MAFTTPCELQIHQADFWFYINGFFLPLLYFLVTHMFRPRYSQRPTIKSHFDCFNFLLQNTKQLFLFFYVPSRHNRISIMALRNFLYFVALKLIHTGFEFLNFKRTIMRNVWITFTPPPTHTIKCVLSFLWCLLCKISENHILIVLFFDIVLLSDFFRFYV